MQENSMSQSVESAIQEVELRLKHSKRLVTVTLNINSRKECDFYEKGTCFVGGWL